jgi:hypothetical protein
VQDAALFVLHEAGQPQITEPRTSTVATLEGDLDMQASPANGHRQQPDGPTHSPLERRHLHITGLPHVTPRARETGRFSLIRLPSVTLLPRYRAGSTFQHLPDFRTAAAFMDSTRPAPH